MITYWLNCLGFLKVETIGDAYMVVGGVPVPTKTHAHKVVNFALGMRIAVREVTNPVIDKPIQVRILHFNAYPYYLGVAVI